jgi:hypothetical protein
VVVAAQVAAIILLQLLVVPVVSVEIPLVEQAVIRGLLPAVVAAHHQPGEPGASVLAEMV